MFRKPSDLEGRVLEACGGSRCRVTRRWAGRGSPGKTPAGLGPRAQLRGQTGRGARAVGTMARAGNVSRPSRGGGACLGPLPTQFPAKQAAEAKPVGGRTRRVPEAAQGRLAHGAKAKGRPAGRRPRALARLLPEVLTGASRGSRPGQSWGWGGGGVRARGLAFQTRPSLPVPGAPPPGPGEAGTRAPVTELGRVVHSLLGQLQGAQVR